MLHMMYTSQTGQEISQSSFGSLVLLVFHNIQPNLNDFYINVLFLRVSLKLLILQHFIVDFELGLISFDFLPNFGDF